ncbi:MAG: hypothetical protein SV775_10525, partial [Thermodesulfobacteriota bacterium]|nr:hypothetical protein [Thermodesulfobacteriota bacterium]
LKQKYSSRPIIDGGAVHAVYDPLPNLRLAFAAILTRQDEKARGDLVNDETDFTRRDRFRFGIGYFPDERTSIAFDFVYISNHFPLDPDERFDTERYCVGLERWMTDNLAIRLGCYDEAFTAGLGLKWRELNLDYVFADDWGVNDNKGLYGKDTETHVLAFTFKY